MRGEVLRELGEFDRAAGLLDTSYPREWSAAVQTIKWLMTQRDRYVRQIQVRKAD